MGLQPTAFPIRLLHQRSAWRDLNPRFPAPKAGARPGWATRRKLFVAGWNRTNFSRFSICPLSQSSTATEPPAGESNPFRPVDSRVAIRQRREGIWQGQRDSNPRFRIWNPTCSPLTLCPQGRLRPGRIHSTRRYIRLSEALVVASFRTWRPAGEMRFELIIQGFKGL